MAEESTQSPVGSPPRYFDPNATSAFTTQYILDDPVVEAVYPSFIIISWTPPHNLSSSGGGVTSTTTSAMSSPQQTPAALSQPPPLPVPPLSTPTSAGPRAPQSTPTTGGPATAAAAPRATWKYIVEWIGSFSIDTHSAHMGFCHAVIPIEFTHESYNIRLVAKGTILASVDQSSNVFVTATITVPTRQATMTRLPWLHDDAVMSPVVRDALILSGYLHDLEDAAKIMWNLRNDVRHNNSLSGDITAPSSSSSCNRSLPEFLGRGALKHCQFTAVRVQYPKVDGDPDALRMTPLRRRDVVYVLTEPLSGDVVYVLTEPLSASASPSPKRTTSSSSSSVITGAQLIEWVKERGCSLVFAGVGSAGTAASFAAHRLIASVLQASDQSTISTNDSFPTRPSTDHSPATSSSPSGTHRERTTSGHRALGMRRSMNTSTEDLLCELDPVCRHVFAVTFGSPREDFFSNGVVLARTTQYSGQFLHYSSMVNVAARTSGFAIRSANHAHAPPLQKSPSSSSSSTLSKHASVPLGIRVGPAFDVASRRYFLRAAASHFERRNEEEDLAGPFDTLGALVMLDIVHSRQQQNDQGQLTLDDALQAYRPTVTSVTATSDAERTGFSVFLTIRGTMLHLHPKVMIDLITCRGDESEESSPARRMVSMLGRSAVTCELVYVSPVKILARCTLLDIASMHSVIADPNPAATFSVHVANSAGVVSEPTKVSLKLSHLHVVLAAGPLPTAPDRWINGTPLDLLNACVTLEPVLASAQSPAESSFLPHTTTKLLMALESIADITAANVAAIKKPAGGSSFFSAIAAKVNAVQASAGVGGSSSGSAAQSLAQPLGQVLPASGNTTVFLAALTEHIHKRRPARVFQANCAAWRSKLLAAFPWLSDGGYRAKLQSLIDVVVLKRPTQPSSSANAANNKGGSSSPPSGSMSLPSSPTSVMATSTVFGQPNADGTSSPSQQPNFIALEALLTTHVFDFLSRGARVFPNATFMEPFSHLMAFEVFYRVIHPLLLAATAGDSHLPNVKTPLDLFLDAAALWVITTLFQLRLQHALHRTVLVCTPSRGCGAATLMNELKLMRNDDEHDVLGTTMASRRPLPTTASTSSLGDSTNVFASPSSQPQPQQPSQAAPSSGGEQPLPVVARSVSSSKTLRQLQRVVIHRLVAETIDDALEVANLCGDVVIVFAAEAHDICSPANQHWLREVSSRRAGRIIVVVTKLDECLLRGNDAAAKTGVTLFKGGVPLFGAPTAAPTSTASLRGNVSRLDSHTHDDNDNDDDEDTAAAKAFVRACIERLHEP
ncbi:Hypothetical protein, putative [Bodo saltans]|uniref:Uncharacterized protein n=1 Tax=Bodo saltans TaxID=75058 RepID=A0A0S4JNK0_BODSA|nr:Hypothetical protein, putative [Bodo saltans]|eukprot:CUG91800.1 Hypothetical protein, putative [Bodo saltans]